MTEFLKQVAQHYFNEGNIESCCFILPNKRSKAFLNKYLREIVAKESARPILAPQSTTIDDFFYKITGRKKTDRTRLLIELYEQYSRLNKNAESLDDFIFWGDVLLADFDDVDKYLVNAEHIFTNISQLKDLQDDLSYLTDNQREAIDRLVGHFRKESRVDDNPKQRFLRIWNILLPLYSSFKESLIQKGLSYEGQVYRELADRMDHEAVSDILSEKFKNSRLFVFVGLNALNECEKKLLRKMRDAKLAQFCWDYMSDMIKDEDNKSSFFMRNNVIEFPQAFKLESLESETKFNTLEVASGIGQAKELPEILKLLGIEGRADIETAIVLADEGLLLPVLNAIPDEVEKLNVTMGYPIKSSASWDLLVCLSTLQLHSREKDGHAQFYYKSVYELFSNSMLRSAVSEAGKELISRIRNDKKYYIPEEDFSVDGLLALIFKSIVKDPNDCSTVDNIAEYQKAVINAIALAIKAKIETGECEDMSMELEFCKGLIHTISRIQSCKLQIKAATYFKLLIQLLSGSSVPFEGEPLNGLQIMGPLETRALDFDNVIILSCNEGMFPRKSISSSFIPAEVRKGFELPTYEYQDAVWAYYFYRLIQRAKNVWMVFDSRKGGVKGGEESRYIRQLKMHFNKEVQQYKLNAQISVDNSSESITKTEQDIKIFEDKVLSASTLGYYLSCPVKFYYHCIKGLYEEDEISETLDSRLIGTVFHSTMERLFKEGTKVSIPDFEKIRKDESLLKSIIHEEIINHLKCSEISGRNIIFAEMIYEYVDKALERDIEMMQDENIDEINIIGLERKFNIEIHGHKFKGFIDRIDSLSENSIRVLDYKTGTVHDEEMNVNEGNYEKVLNSIDLQDDSKRMKIAFQMYIYDKYLESMNMYNGLQKYNSIYNCTRLFTEKIVNAPVYEPFIREMDEKVKNILDEISNPEINWECTQVRENCKYCPFKNLCAR